MTGSYLTYNRETLIFQLQHQTIFESVMLSYYRLDPKSVLNMIDFEMLQEVVKLGNNNEREGEIKMIVPKNLYGVLAKRLFLIFRSQFRQTPSTFIKVLCDSDLMTHVDSDFILQLGKHFFEASNYNITTIITYDGKSEEVVFCFLAVILWYSTIKYWQSEDIKIILHSLKTTLQSETRSNVKYACKRTITAAFLYSCDKENTNDIIEPFVQTIHELEISFNINRCFQDLVDRQIQPVASCVLHHFSQKINIVETILETDRENLNVLMNILSGTFLCSNVQFSGTINDRTSIIKWLFSSVDSKKFNMTEAVQMSGNKGLMEIVDWFITTFQYKLFECQLLMKEACSKGWEIVVKRFLQEDEHRQPFDLKSIMIAACQYSWHTILKQLLKKSTSETFDVTLLMTEACRKFDFENVKSLIIYIGEKDINLNNTMNDVSDALKGSQPWSFSEFCTSFIKVLLKNIDSDEKEDLESLNTINLLLDGISELTFNIRFALVDVISNDVIHKQRVLQLFIDNNLIKQIKVSLLLLDACRMMNNELVTWLLKNIDNESLKVTTSFNESCTYGRLQIIKIMIQYSDHKLLNFSSAFLCSVKEEWRQHHEQNEEVMKFLFNTIDHSLFDFNTIAKEIILLKQEDFMKILLNNVDIRSFGTEQVVDYACEQGLLEILEKFWKSEKKEQKDIFSVVSRALKGSKLDIVNWFRAFNKARKVGNLQLVIWILDNLDQAASLDIVKCILDKEDHNIIDLKKVLYDLYKYCHNYKNEHTLLLFKMIVKNVDWKRLDMKTVMKVACKLKNLDIVEYILDKEDHTLLDMNSVMSQACEAGNIDIVKCILDKVDHNLIDFSTFMNAAFTVDSLDIVEYILDKVDHKLLDMNSAIIQACGAGNAEIVKLILDKVDHTLLDMSSFMTRACEAGNTDIVKCVLDKVDHTLLDMSSFVTRACEAGEAGNTDILKCVLDKVDHNLIDFEDVLYEFYEYEENGNYLVLKVIVENVDWKQLDMKKVMNLACTLDSLDIVECVLDKVDHTLLDINSAVIRACREGNTDILKWILDNVEHNLIDFKAVISKLYEYYPNNCFVWNLRVLKVLLENMSWKQLDMKTVMNVACTLDRLDIIECILEKEDHKLLDINSAMIRAWEIGNIDIVKYVLDKVDHNLIDFKAVINKLYEYCHTYKRSLRVLEMFVENVDWKQLDMKKVMNLACTLDSLDIVECILDKVDHTLLDITSAMTKACEARKIDIVKCVLDKVDHNLIDFKAVINKFYEYCYNHTNERKFMSLTVTLVYFVPLLRVLEVLVENVDWKQLDMKTVMNLACTLASLDIVECILDKVDHTLLDITSAMTIACEARKIDIVKCVLDKVDHNLIDFKDVTSKLYEYCHNYKNERKFMSLTVPLVSFVPLLRVLEVLVENVDWKQLHMKTVMNVVCKLNCLDIAECILDKVDHTLLDMNSAMMRACEAGNTYIVKYILDHIDHEMLDINSVMTAAIKRHDLFIVKYLCNNVNKISLNMKVAFNETCKLGNHELVIWILENVDQSQLDIKTAMLKACCGPNDETVKLLNQRFGENMFDIKSSMNNACRYGNIAVIRWLWSKTDKQHVCDMKSALINACLSGKEGNVKWLVENIDQSQFDIQASITETFVNRINVTNVIKTLLNHSDRSLVNMNTIIVEACAIGNMALVKWLLKTSDRNLVDISQALYSLLNIKSKITDNYSEYNKWITLQKRSLVLWVLKKYSLSLFDMNNTVKEICRNGWTDILQWIWGNSQNHSLEIGPAINVACVNGHKELVEWALSNIDAKSLDTETLMNESCGNGLLTLAKWMWENIEHSKLDMRTAMNDACAFCRIETAQWILENVDVNLLDTGNVLNEASKHGWLSVVKDLLKDENLSQYNVCSALTEACMNGHLNIVECMFTKFGKDILDIESILPGLCSNPVNEKVAKFLISQFKNQLRLFTNVMPHACGFGWTEVVEMLLQDTDHTGIVMRDSLLNACRQGEVDVVKIILSKVDHTQLDIAEAFIIVCTRGWEKITEFLLDEIEHTAFDMKSALTEASRSGEEDIVELLFQKVKPEKFDIQMAIDAASQNHMHENIVYQLLQRNCYAKFEQDRLKKKAEEHDWPKVLSIISGKFNSANENKSLFY